MKMSVSVRWMPLLIMGGLLCVLTACRPTGDSESPVGAADSVLPSHSDATATVETEEETIAEASVPVMEPSRRAIASKPRQQAKTEQLYVTGYNAYGRLWGYVTMKGDHGTGVIHDAEENHYNVQCTRHGNELFAVDQNSRQYVLKY